MLIYYIPNYPPSPSLKIKVTMHERKFRQNNPVKLNESKVRLIFDLAQTKSVKEIADIFDVNINTIYRVLKGATWRHIGNETIKRYRGTARKLDEQKVLLIRSVDKCRTKTQEEYASQLGISPNWFSLVANKHGWSRF
jgi:transposase